MVKKILISQPKPTGKNPYAELEENYNIEVQFKKFFDIKPISAKEFKQQKINLADFTGIIFPSRTAIDHFFHLVQEIKYTVPNTMKYFCMNERIALYLQKYTVYRKRRIFIANGTADSLVELLEKHKSEKLLLPISEGHKSSLYTKLKKNKFDVSTAEIYRSVPTDLSDINIDQFDMIVLFSPWGVKSLLENFPDITDKKIIIASYGNETAKALKKAGLQIDIKIPNKHATSMLDGIKQYLAQKVEA